jgi:hypothetical protein
VRRFARLLLVTVGFGALGFAMSLVPQKSATGSGGAPVNIVGSVPLTVQGTVAAQQSGTWNVNAAILGNVPVKNSVNPDTQALLPIVTRDLEAPGLNPFQAVLIYPTSFQAAVPSSPARELVIDFVSISGIVVENAGFTTVVPVAELATFSGGVSLPHFLLVQAAANGNPGEFQLIGSETTRIYADPGTFISFFLNVPGTVSNGIVMTVSGHFVDLS